MYLDAVRLNGDEAAKKGQPLVLMVWLMIMSAYVCSEEDIVIVCDGGWGVRERARRLKLMG